MKFQKKIISYFISCAHVHTLRITDYTKDDFTENHSVDQKMTG